MATRSRERSEQALEQFRGSAVHETQVDETLRLVTPVAHVKHLVQLGPEEAEVGRPECAGRVMSSHLARAEAGPVELPRRDRPAGCSDGDFDRTAGLDVDKEPRGPALPGPADPRRGPRSIPH